MELIILETLTPDHQRELQEAKDQTQLSLTRLGDSSDFSGAQKCFLHLSVEQWFIPQEQNSLGNKWIFLGSFTANFVVIKSVCDSG